MVGERSPALFSIFPNDAACLRLVSEVLIDVDEEWQGDCIDLSFEAADSPSWSH